MHRRLRTALVIGAASLAGALASIALTDETQEETPVLDDLIVWEDDGSLPLYTFQSRLYTAVFGSWLMSEESDVARLYGLCPGDDGQVWGTFLGVRDLKHDILLIREKHRVHIVHHPKYNPLAYLPFTCPDPNQYKQPQA